MVVSDLDSNFDPKSNDDPQLSMERSTLAAGIESVVDMRSFSIFFFILLVSPLWADEMTSMSFRMVYPTEERVFSRMYRYSDTHLRLEKAGTVQIHSGFDVWQLYPTQSVAVHSKDPDGKIRVWIYHPDKIPTSFQGLEFGRESEFLKENKFAENGTETVGGRSCRILSLKKPDGVLQFWLDKAGNPVQLQLSRNEEPIFRIRYDSYEQVDLDLSLFHLPAGTRVAVGKQLLPSSSAVYEPWLGRVLSKYGAGQMRRFARHLSEDLAPTLEKSEYSVGLTLSEALAKDRSFQQWPALRQAAYRKLEPQVLAKISELAKDDPDATDRAWAYRLLAHAKLTEALLPGLFDKSTSNRLLVMELLSSPVGDMTILLPSRPLNVFHYYFLENGMKRCSLEASPGTFFALNAKQRAKKLETSHLASYLELARRHKTKPIAAGVLLLLGTGDEAKQALNVLVEELVAQGAREDDFHGPDFWLRGDIIQILGQCPQPKLLAGLLDKALDSYSKEKEMLLLALAYALDEADAPSAAPALSRIKALKTDNYDLYLAGALALSKYDPDEAKVSLLHVLSLKRQPFVTMALRRLEKMTGIVTPGWNNSELFPDPDSAFKFWSEKVDR